MEEIKTSELQIPQIFKKVLNDDLFYKSTNVLKNHDYFSTLTNRLLQEFKEFDKYLENKFIRVEGKNKRIQEGELSLEGRKDKIHFKYIPNHKSLNIKLNEYERIQIIFDDKNDNIIHFDYDSTDKKVKSPHRLLIQEITEDNNIEIAIRYNDDLKDFKPNESERKILGRPNLYRGEELKKSELEMPKIINAILNDEVLKIAMRELKKDIDNSNSSCNIFLNELLKEFINYSNYFEKNQYVNGTKEDELESVYYPLEDSNEIVRIQLDSDEKSIYISNNSTNQHTSLEVQLSYKGDYIASFLYRNYRNFDPKSGPKYLFIGISDYNRLSIEFAENSSEKANHTCDLTLWFDITSKKLLEKIDDNYCSRSLDRIRHDIDQHLEYSKISGVNPVEIIKRLNRLPEKYKIQVKELKSKLPNKL